MAALLKKIFGTSNDRYVKSLDPIVKKINALEQEFEKLSDEQLRAKTAEFKNKIQTASDEKKILNIILPEAFATVREAAKRTLGQRHYDV